MSAVKEHNRVKPEGQRMGEQLARLTDPQCAKLIAEGEWDKDERCVSCAFRKGTVPNGCPQTQMDALKAVLQHENFNCHLPRDGFAACQYPCMGWFAAMQAVKKTPRIECPWPYSPPDSASP